MLYFQISQKWEHERRSRTKDVHPLPLELHDGLDIVPNSYSLANTGEVREWVFASVVLALVFDVRFLLLLYDDTPLLHNRFKFQYLVSTAAPTVPAQRRILLSWNSSCRADAVDLSLWLSSYADGIPVSDLLALLALIAPSIIVLVPARFSPTMGPGCS